MTVMRLLRGILSRLLGRRMRTTTNTATFEGYYGTTPISGGLTWTSTEIEQQVNGGQDREQ